jgi:integrase
VVYRGVRGSVEDRWFKQVRQLDGSYADAPSARHGVLSRWRARYVDAEGNEREKVFEVKREAEVWLRNRLREVDTGTHIDPSKTKVTISDVHREWEAAQGHLARKTAATRKTAWTTHVQPRWGKVRISEVKTSAVRSWITKMVKDEVGVPTIENSFAVLRMTMAQAVEDGRVPRNPCDGVRLPRRKHADRGYLSHDQVLALANACDRDGLVVRFLAYTGLRWGEMAALRVQDFDMLRRRVRVHRSVTESGGLEWRNPKTHERRSVPFPPTIADDLAKLMVGKKRGDLVFANTRGNVLRNSNWRARVFSPAVAACQESDDTFPSITPHDLRHTAASLAVSAGAHVKAVQRMLGHAKAGMTLDTYADLFDSDLDRVAETLDAAIRVAEDARRPG